MVGSSMSVDHPDSEMKEQYLFFGFASVRIFLVWQSQAPADLPGAHPFRAWTGATRYLVRAYVRKSAANRFSGSSILSGAEKRSARSRHAKLPTAARYWIHIGPCEF
jgi:hypothetical protein